MNRTDDELIAGGRFVFRRVYLALAVAISLLVSGSVWSMPKDISPLYLPGENAFGHAMLIGLLSLPVVGLLLWGIGVQVFLLCKRRISIPHMLGVGVLALSVLMLHFSEGGGSGRNERVTAQLLAIDEAAYLGFAQAMRTEMNSHKEEFISYDPDYSGHSGLPVRPVYGRILSESPLMIWPRRFLGVKLEKDSVVLSRGTGMLGRIGVVIFDKGPLREAQGADHPRASSYSPVEFRLFPSVFYFTSD
jgi:hypothetical protein